MFKARTLPITLLIESELMLKRIGTFKLVNKI